ncbi:hypothetical protein LYSIN_02674 [Lysinibacillus sphaericus]|uniref:Uncharacterized protein n=1 Tax=Lysinibacillus sphaericus TaxID=1421 RepID=A0A2S5D490_LYSSH|nr:hypothetical protein LYSIN_02674 [Lysinibacillus sphaericus]
MVEILEQSGANTRETERDTRGTEWNTRGAERDIRGTEWNTRGAERDIRESR